VKIYFPQWQGSGTGKTIENGAKTILDYLDDPKFIHVPLSEISAGKNGINKHDINNYDAITEQLTRLKKSIDKAQPNTIKTIGGDCGLEIVPVSYLNKKYPNLGVIWFDAHADINLPEESQSHNFHGMPLRTLIGEGNDELKQLLFTQINPSQIHYIGLRSIDTAEQERINKDHIYAPLTLDITHLIKTLKEKNITELYIHFDVDCLDPNAYRSAYFNVNNGITTAEAEHYITELKANFSVVGTSILESVAMTEQQLNPIKNIIKLLFNH